MKETRPEIKNEYHTPSPGEDAELCLFGGWVTFQSRQETGKKKGMLQRGEQMGKENRPTCVLTPKSQSLTCPLVFTSILEGFTSKKGGEKST